MGCSRESVGSMHGYVAIAMDGEESLNLLMVDLSGRQVDTGLSCSPGGCSRMVWAPDGTKIVLYGPPHCVLDTSTLECTTHLAPYQFVQWSQDSTHALFVDPDSNMLYRAVIDGSERQDIIEVSQLETVSPDEAYAVDWRCPEGQHDCDYWDRTPELLDLRTAERRAYPCVAPVIGCSNVDMPMVKTKYWFSDNRTVLVTETYRCTTSSWMVWTCNVETGETEKVVDADYDKAPTVEISDFPVSPDERWLAFPDGIKNGTGFTVVDLKNGFSTHFVELPHLHGVLDFTYDSRYLVVYGQEKTYAFDLAKQKLIDLPLSNDLVISLSPVWVELPSP